MSEAGWRGVAIIAWGLLVCLLLYGVQAAAGLKYVQGVIWPTDLYTFEHSTSGPIDVAVLGSSRASFGASPSMLDACLSEKLGRPTQTVNLARTFATAWTTRLQVRSLLSGERTPRVMVWVVDPEFFNEHNHQSALSTPANADLRDIPSALWAVGGLADVYAALRPLARGPESIALFLAGRHERDDHLRWMMLHHGGGQYCFEGDICEQNNTSVLASLEGRWGTAQSLLIPRVREERFSRFAIGEGGRVDRAAQETIREAAAQGTRVVLAVAPLHQTFLDQIPAPVMDAFRAYIARLAAEHDNVSAFAVQEESWPRTRNRFIDPDHLSATGSRRFSLDLCHSTLLPLFQQGDEPQGHREDEGTDAL